MATKVKNFGKRVIHYPEDPVPVVSSRDWVKGVFANPLQKVCLPLSVDLLAAPLTASLIGHKLLGLPLPYLWLDSPLQYVIARRGHQIYADAAEQTLGGHTAMRSPD